METQVHLQTPSQVISLATSAVLVSVEVNVWSATKQDRGISDEVTTAKNADSSAGRFVKNLLADDQYHKRVSNYRQTIYNWLQRETYGWNKSDRLLPVVDLERFKKGYAEHDAEFNRLLDEFCNNYSTIVSDMAFKQGTMFNREDYPTVEQVRNKFGLKLYVREVPSHDWRCRISQDIAEDLRQQYESQAKEIVQGVMEDQVSRLSELLNSISHCCGVDEVEKNGETKTKKRKIYDTTIEKAKALAKQLQEFNLTNNQELNEAALNLEEALNGVDAETIRESEAVRAKVKDDVDNILSKFNW